MSIFDVFKPIVPAYEQRRGNKKAAPAPLFGGLFAGLFECLQPVQPDYTSRKQQPRIATKRGGRELVRRVDVRDQEPKP